MEEECCARINDVWSVVCFVYEKEFSSTMTRMRIRRRKVADHQRIKSCPWSRTRVMKKSSRTTLSRKHDRNAEAGSLVSVARPAGAETQAILVRKRAAQSPIFAYPQHHLAAAGMYLQPKH